MLLKYSQAQKRIKTTGVGKPQRTAGGMVKLTSSLMTVVPKIHRKVIKVACKRPTTIHRPISAVKREHIHVDPCENSNDSGLGFDHHLDYHHHSHPLPAPLSSALRFSDKETLWHSEEPPEVKRRRLEIKLESDDANDNFTFPDTVRQPVPRAVCIPLRRRALPVTLTSQLTSVSQDGRSQLVIACQPETQHRARYQTEGSRGAVKDRSGNGFPVVKLVGYDRPATLQVFIGTDQGRVAPHMFYQACRVSGKNSTPCVERKIDGTIVIEVDIEPTKDMIVTCDCVGILKERNVDVEHRFPEEGSGRSKKKSTRCRMVFRTTITNPDGSQETLQVTSMPIVCTQPPGVPEICKKSLSSSNVRGGQELFILGKNFLKDTRVLFQEGESSGPAWCQSVQPDKEFLQQSHLVCVVPPYQRIDITEPLSVRLIVESSGKASEPHTFTYLPDNTSPQSADNHTVLAEEGNVGNNSVSTSSGNAGVFCPPHAAPSLLLPPESSVSFMATQTSPQTDEKMQPMMMWDKHMDVMMPPPPTLLPISVRRSSVQMIVPESLAPEDMKTEIEETLEPPKTLANVSDLSGTQPPSMDTLHKYVTSSSLPSINVRKYLSDIEGKNIFTKEELKPQLINEMPQIMIPAPITINKSMFPCDSTNLLTTVEPILVNQASAGALNSRDVSVIPSASQSLQENLSVIVDSTMVQKKSPNLHLQHNRVSDSQHIGLDLMISANINKQAQSMAERLDDFVNSAADSHISPTPIPSMPVNSITPENAVINSMSGVLNGTNDMNKLQESNISLSIQPIPLNLTSSHQGAGSMRSICSVLPPSTPQSHVDSTNPTPLGNQNTNACQAEIIHSPPMLQKVQSHGFSRLQQISLDEHLSSHSLTTSSQLNHELNQLMQSQTTSNSDQSVSNLQSALDQVMSSKNNHSDLNTSNIMQSSSLIPSNQCQNMQNINVSLEQQLNSETITSSQINNCGLNNMIQSSPGASRTKTQTLNSLQVSLEHNLSNQQIEQTTNNSHIGSLSSETAGSSHCHPLLNPVQGFSTLLSSQVCQEPIALHSQCLQQGSFSLNRMDTTSQVNASETSNLPSFEHHMSSQAIPTSSQANGNQSQLFSDIQNTFNPQLGSQSLPPPSPFLNSLSPNCGNSAASTSQAGNQAQDMSDLQMSLNHLTSQNSKLVSNNSSCSLNDSISAASQIQVAENLQNRMISNLSVSLGQHLPSESMTMSQPDSVMTDSVQTSHHNSLNENLPSLQASLDHFASQTVNCIQARHAESYTSNLHGSQSLNEVPLTSSPTINNISNADPSNELTILTPCTSHHSTLSISQPEVGIHSTSGMTSQSAMSVPQQIGHTSPQRNINSNVIMNTPEIVVTADLTMKTSSTMDRQMEHSHTAGQFDQRPADQVAAMNQFEERSETQPAVIVSQTQTLIPQVKKCEEGMPVPHEITQMSENDLISYINPSCFDTV